MRHSVIWVLFLLPCLAWTAPKQRADFFVLSKRLRTQLANEKSPVKKTSGLKDLEKELQVTQKEYQNKTRSDGEEAEHKVLFFAATFEPLFNVKNFDKTGCDKARAQVIREGRMGKPDNVPFDEETQEALEWVKLLCK
jgi:hypothetical protein